MLGKPELLNLLVGRNRGVGATAEQRAVILAAIARLEERNPTPRPIEAPDRLDGDWQLLYTTSDELLGIDRLPLFRLGEIYQCLRCDQAAVVNVAEVRNTLPGFSGLPWFSGLVSVVARFEPVSAQRVQVKFERAIVGSQGLAAYDRSSLAAWVDQRVAGDRLRAVQIALNSDRQQGWLDVTYLDDTLRISRGNNQSVFVLRRAIV